jgi:plastocyanin
MLQEMNKRQLSPIIVGITFLSILTISSPLLTDSKVSASISNGVSEELIQPQLANSNSGSTATDIFNTGELMLGSDVKDLVVLIPNEGHHGPGEDDEARFTEQSFVPETLVINKGTNVIWFNGDVGHDHNLVINRNSTSTGSIYQTGDFTEFEARNYTFNEPGRFQYADTVEYDNGYIMKGNISVVDEGDGGVQQPMTNSSTVGLLMVPTQAISQYTSDLQSRGFVLDSSHSFQDLRGGQSGTGDEQTLILWRMPGDVDISNILNQLAEFSKGLPYS